MTRRYAEGTSVSVDRSMGEIRQVLRRYGAEEFSYGERLNTIGVSFIIQGIHVRISVRLPDPRTGSSPRPLPRDMSGRRSRPGKPTRMR